MFTFNTFLLIINILEAFIVKTNNNIKNIYIIIGESCFLLTQALLVQMHVLFFSILFDRKSETLQSYFKRPFKRMTVTANHIL